MSEQEKKPTVTQVLDEIEAEICDNYCKYPDDGTVGTPYDICEVKEDE